jgi:hypothetical protein
MSRTHDGHYPNAPPRTSNRDLVRAINHDDIEGLFRIYQPHPELLLHRVEDARAWVIVHPRSGRAPSVLQG